MILNDSGIYYKEENNHIIIGKITPDEFCSPETFRLSNDMSRQNVKLLQSNFSNLPSITLKNQYNSIKLTMLSEFVTPTSINIPIIPTKETITLNRNQLAESSSLYITAIIYSCLVLLLLLVIISYFVLCAVKDLHILFHIMFIVFIVLNILLIVFEAIYPNNKYKMESISQVI